MKSPSRIGAKFGRPSVVMFRAALISANGRARKQSRDAWVLTVVEQDVFDTKMS